MVDRISQEEFGSSNVDEKDSGSRRSVVNRRNGDVPQATMK